MSILERNTEDHRDRCYDFKNIFAKKFGEKSGVSYCNLIISMVFEKMPFFRGKWQKSQKLVIIASTPVSNSDKFLLKDRLK
jgi:hypothetical protein